jgi:Transposase DDE domain group 1
MLSLVAPFDTPHQNFDGGAILLMAIDDALSLTSRLAACLSEWHQEGKIEHDLPTLIRQRSFGLPCGYTDANDAARLKDNPIH